MSYILHYAKLRPLFFILKNIGLYFAIDLPLHHKKISKMAETKGRKIYALTSNCEIIGVWSNLTSLVNDFNKSTKTLSYFKIYRQIKFHTEGGLLLENFTYEFRDKDGIAYQIKVKALQ